MAWDIPRVFRGAPIAARNRRVEHFYEEIGSCAGGAYFTLEIRGVRARVCLMDAENYQAYLDEEEYQYHGGFWESSPVPSDWTFQRGRTSAAPEVVRSLTVLGARLRSRAFAKKPPPWSFDDPATTTTSPCPP